MTINLLNSKYPILDLLAPNPEVFWLLEHSKCFPSLRLTAKHEQVCNISHSAILPNQVQGDFFFPFRSGLVNLRPLTNAAAIMSYVNSGLLAIDQTSPLSKMAIEQFSSNHTNMAVCGSVSSELLIIKNQL